MPVDEYECRTQRRSDRDPNQVLVKVVSGGLLLLFFSKRHTDHMGLGA